MNNILSNKYDLEERTMDFSKEVILLCKSIDKNVITLPLINQLVRAATSIGANYCEANGASSKKDFRNKTFICKKEAKETMYWLQVLAAAQENKKDALRILWQEAKELTMIFSKISASSK